MVVELHPEFDALLRQASAGVEMEPQELAKILLESSLVMSLSR
jgi:hypothetical protein